MKKTYADGSAILTQYGYMNRASTVTNARGQTISYTYDEPTGLLSGKDYSDGTPSIRYHYNHLGQYARIEDASGEHLFEYDHYQRPGVITSSNGIIEELYDDYGRSFGYRLDEEYAMTPQIHYSEEGRISKVEMASGYEISYDYLPGTNLVNMLRYDPWAMEKTISYEEQRDLPVEMTYLTHNSPEPYPVIRTQINDALGRPVSRSQERGGTDPVHYAYQYNSRSELVYATRNTDQYRYQYDNIGNRETAAEELMRTEYLTNPLNQYARIESAEEDDFVPSYDADGNQTLIKTNIGIWEVEYNAESRPVTFTLRQEPSRTTRIECLYDYMGRRFYKRYYHREGTAEETREDHYLYRGYLLVQRTGDNVEYLNAYVWDPTEPINTRLLYYVMPGPQIIFCGHDFNKNVTELFHYDLQTGVEESRTYYDYTPYGVMSGEGELSDSNPFCFSNEYQDQELGLVYYNYRHYNLIDGRWISRDLIEEEGGINLYTFVGNAPTFYHDLLGFWRLGAIPPNPLKEPQRYNYSNWTNLYPQNLIVGIANRGLGGLISAANLDTKSLFLLFMHYYSQGEGGTLHFDYNIFPQDNQFEESLSEDFKSGIQWVKGTGNYNKLISMNEWAQTDASSWYGSYLLGGFRYIVSGIVNEKCQFTYLLYATDVFDFDRKKRRNCIVNGICYVFGDIQTSISKAHPFRIIAYRMGMYQLNGKHEIYKLF